MNKVKLNQIIVAGLLLILPAVSAFAQDDFDDDVDDLTPPAPIDDYVWLMLVVAIYVAFRFFKQKQITNSVQ
jgi:hypothetical protein